MKKCLILFIFSASLAFSTKTYSQSFDYKALEKITSGALSKAYSASVRMWGYDTVKKQQNSAQFSGVVVTAEGHILTAAHATVPGNTYKVFFPDGQERIAVALGRIGFKEKQNLPDVAMMKIIGNGKWPFAEMGWSSSLKTNEPCVSIAYPETLSQSKPSVRFGRISVPMTQWGFVQSTCKMEPGDSGGPLFDYMGRVIALHSRIDKPEDVNFEVPVDLYRKYWTALNKSIDYDKLPDEENDVLSDPFANKIITIPALENIGNQFLNLESKFKGTSLVIKSVLNGKEQQALGALFLLDKMLVKSGMRSGSFIIGKSTLIGNNPIVNLGSGKLIKAVVVARDKSSDLVLLQLPKKLKTGITAKMLKDTSAIQFNELGKFLLSALPGQTSKVSVLGSQLFSLPRKFSSGYFGANATFINQQIILTRVTPGSPAADKLELQDQITGINGTPISQPPQYGAEIMKYAPGDTISIQGVRKGVPYSLPVALTVVPVRGNHPADKIEGGKSIRLDDFKSVFTHDAAISAAECGGPLFDANGRFYGINIARFSRTSILTIPAGTIYDFLKDSL
ncbi:trypsin-like peptidase domain-containing protein [Pedobacter frigoris]|uniref:trypsin-like peptidase domain-containing protein n=1 Tax=Pedobacter frigoris TaxID=2571272 RepID=UPI00292DDBBF|nr:trypsin-like peptidase domain-containing protein [Pedobacter frigoris]